MIEGNKKIIDEHLTQKDIVQLLLHNAQHMVTREELKSDIKELKSDISRVEDKMSKVEDKMSKVEDKISKVEAKFDKIQWLIIATMFTVIFKDYIFSIIQAVPTP